MRKFYLRFRILLMTFTLSLANVFIFNGSLKFSDEIPVNLPKTEFGDVMIVFPRCRFEMPGGGGGGRIHWNPKLTKCVENSSH